MDIQGLSQINLKDIDVPYLLRRFGQQKELLIGIAMVISTIVMAIQTFDGQSKKMATLRDELASQEEKDLAISNYLKAQKVLEEEFDSLPQGTNELDKMINRINDFAARHNIQIQSVNPEGTINTDIYEIIHLSLSVNAHDYAELGLFINDIESSNLNLRVDIFNITLRQPETRGRGQAALSVALPTENIFPVSMKISSLQFKKK